MRVPAAFLAESVSSDTNLVVFVPAEHQVNSAKGRLASLTPLIGKGTLKTLIKNAASHQGHAPENNIQQIRPGMYPQNKHP
jgi:hypothetical protein